jgi:hypothetical protein
MVDEDGEDADRGKRTSSRFTGTPIDIRCSLLTLDRVQSRGFNIGAVVN